MKYPVYPVMKDSSIEWLGEIPNHWEEVKLRFVTKSIKNGTSVTQLEESPDRYMVTRIETISTGKIDYGKVGYIDYFEGLKKYKLQKDDILFSNINSLEKVGNCAIYNAVKPLYAGMNVLHLRPNNRVKGNWLWYWILSSKVNDTIKAWSKHAVNQVSISVNTLSDIPVLIPPLNEQKMIANFLDKETGRIDQLIEKKEQLISLLEEKRQATINHVVTKGLNSNVPMKDSGIEWLGEISENWEISKLKYVIKLINNKIDNVNNNIIYIGLENIESNKGKLLDKNTGEEVLGSAILFKKGDVLFGKLRPYLAKVIIVEFDGACTSELLVMRTQKVLQSRFLMYLLLSNKFIELVNSSTYGAKMPRASWDFIGNISITLPNINEQKQIADYLDKETTKIDNLIEKIKQQISNLKEYRQALISNTVTGKIDVREVYQDE